LGGLSLCIVVVHVLLIWSGHLVRYVYRAAESNCKHGSDLQRCFGTAKNQDTFRCRLSRTDEDNIGIGSIEIVEHNTVVR